MKDVILTKLPMIDLNVKYARKMEDGSFIHYSIPFQYCILANNDCDSIVRNHILKTEGKGGGINQIIIQLPPEVVPDFTAFKYVAIDDFFVGHEKIKKALEKKHLQGMIYCYLKTTITENIFNFFANIYNKVFVRKYSRLIALKGERKTEVVSHIAYAHTEDQKDQVRKLILDKLTLANNKKAILGHLSKPASFELADFIGDGVPKFITYTTVFIDKDKMEGEEVSNHIEGGSVEELFLTPKILVVEIKPEDITNEL